MGGSIMIWQVALGLTIFCTIFGLALRKPYINFLEDVFDSGAANRIVTVLYTFMAIGIVVLIIVVAWILAILELAAGYI